MRVLTLVHQYLPKNVAGTEIYTRALALALAERGHSVRLLFSEVEPGKPQGTVTRGEHEGIPYDRISCHFRFEDFETTYANAASEAAFERLLREFRPDVVHAQHLQTLSVRMPAIAAARGVPFVMTLAEYLLLCPLWGQLIKRDLSRCEVPGAAECGRCLAGAPFFSDLLRGRDPTAAVDARRQAVRALFNDVAVFVAPSAFLRGRFEAFGFPGEKIRVLDYGFRTEGYARERRRARARGEPVRFGYVGSWVPYKGVHLLPDAFLPMQPDGGFTLDLFGDPESTPDYARPILDRISGSSLVRFRGPFPPANVAAILASLDVLVVPSVWYENSPLTIHEAFLAGVPVVASRLGGMAELVEEERSGLLFAPGDAADLRAAARRLVREDDLLDRLRAGIPEVKPIERNALEMEAVFETAIASARRTGRSGLRRLFSFLSRAGGRGGRGGAPPA